MRDIWLFSISSWGLNFPLFSHTQNISVQSKVAEMNRLLQLWLQLKAPLNNRNSLYQPLNNRNSLYKVHKPGASSGSEDAMRNREL